MTDLRGVPSVDQLLQTRQAVDLIADFGRGLTLEAIRTTLDSYRQTLKNGAKSPLDLDNLLSQVQFTLGTWSAPSLVPVINASGVILHTNLGRAPLSRSAIRAIEDTASGFCSLEYDLEKGVRSTRSVHAEGLLMRLTGAEAALVVNNNAAALLLCITALARRKRVVIARSQLVEIGGGFRIPDVMRQSGAKLVEVGTTNRVHVWDYEEALAEEAALVLRAHHSNFKIIGFTTEPEIQVIVQAAHNKGVPVLDDLGSGALLDTSGFGLAHEPTVQESLKAGADLVCFSGDKLLGGPQAGIIVGKADLIAIIKKHPLARAVRADKLCLAALSATLLHYLKGEAEREIPIWQMIAAIVEDLRNRAGLWKESLMTGELIEGRSTIGGGSLPEETLPTVLLAMNVARPNHFLSLLRTGNPAIIARVDQERVVFDPRSVLPEHDKKLVAGIQAALSKAAIKTQRGKQ
jgi:L-seryl-tRNA(Ser) seleniumtransferase